MKAARPEEKMLLTKAARRAALSAAALKAQEGPTMPYRTQRSKKCLPLFGENDRSTKKRDGTEMDAKCQGRSEQRLTERRRILGLKRKRGPAEYVE